jgi:hypothetical protein
VLTIAGSAAPVAVGTTSAFVVVDRGRGRVALRTTDGFLSVATKGEASRVIVRRGDPGDAETFQWVETLYGDVAFLSLTTHRYLRLDAARGVLSADHPGLEPGRADGAQFRWEQYRPSPGATRQQHITRANPR